MPSCGSPVFEDGTIEIRPCSSIGQSASLTPKRFTVRVRAGPPPRSLCEQSPAASLPALVGTTLRSVRDRLRIPRQHAQAGSESPQTRPVDPQHTRRRRRIQRHYSPSLLSLIFAATQVACFRHITRLDFGIASGFIKGTARQLQVELMRA